ncbi:uroporphyrinogen-III decarboxylase [Anaerolinea thermolimosa]|uniref:uroporphyrinogen decarboxylase family protein n=1 Tax=Anaerolinea thermolimosa TaxID=229919 RepID=UPI00078257E7|nr:uroporphyrinogen decarboxylase family protein [Anaerolinea thermolimosa]GAP08042.1 uroporphyrinogen-III decarboxylase [Anaerolinea thermolimosa]
MNARERVLAALNHRQSDRVPLDLGGSAVTGMHVSSVYRLRQALHLDPPGTPVKVVEPYQMLGEIQPDLMDALGVDVVGLFAPRTMFGFRNEGWKPWTTFDGTPVLVPEGFNTQVEENGDLLMYPEGDRSAPPSGRMPQGGFYFDAIVRQPPIHEEKLDPADNLEEFTPISEEDLAYFARKADELWHQSDRAILASFGGTAFGDIALVPAPWLKYPKGIRDIEEWYISTVTRREYVWKVFEKQCEIGLANLARLYAVVGEKVSVVFISGTDFGTQTGPFISRKTYRTLYQPFHKQVNDWIHRNTGWKSFIHSCGSVAALIPDFIEAGFDVLNPVQVSASGMDPAWLKREFGKDLVFWGGGVDTQHTLPFGSPDEVRAEVRKHLRIFGEGGGYVFTTVHNVQAGVPLENLLALYETVREAA